MKLLKIGILGSRGIPNNYGGYEQFASVLSAGLVQRGHDVTVYNSDQHPFKENEWNGVKIIHCKDWEHKMGTVGQFFYDRNCINDARRRNFDILLHLGYTSDSVWHRRWPKKTVNIVNMDGLEWKRTKYSRLTRRFLKWAESLAANNADVLVADSPAIQQHILEKYKKTSIFIPYGAAIFTTPNAEFLNKYQLKPHEYFMVIARMEPENNIKMILKGYLASEQPFPLIVIGDTSNRFGKYLTSRYRHSKIIFAGSVYDKGLLNNLRYYSKQYFHGHSVGGTNPSLLEAMGCSCTIAAHDNIFNKAVLGNDADYFTNEKQISQLINMKPDPNINLLRQKNNIEKLQTIYSPGKIIDQYEKLMLGCRSR